MIGRLRGLVVERASDGSCVLEVGGVGYEVFVPLGTLGRLAAPPQEVTLEIHTLVREDALMLYGFAGAEDKLAFRALLGVNSVGPKLALAVLGQLNAGALALTIARKDRAALQAVSGVGKKTAERILLDLENKLDVAPGAPAMLDAGAAMVGDAAADVVAALVNLGYKRIIAEGAVARVEGDAREGSLETFLRAALATLSKA